MNKPSTKPEAIAKALTDLQRRVEVGNEEFADAQWAVSSAHNVDYESLGDAYDAADAARRSFPVATPRLDGANGYR